jgi:hypothetical protein
MIVYSSSNLPNETYYMKPDELLSDSTLDLFCDHADESLAEEYALEIEQKASALEVTVDYYMAEFM